MLWTNFKNTYNLKLRRKTKIPTRFLCYYCILLHTIHINCHHNYKLIGAAIVKTCLWIKKVHFVPHTNYIGGCIEHSDSIFVTLFDLQILFILITTPGTIINILYTDITCFLTHYFIPLKSCMTCEMIKITTHLKTHITFCSNRIHNNFPSISSM